MRPHLVLSAALLLACSGGSPPPAPADAALTWDAPGIDSGGRRDAGEAPAAATWDIDRQEPPPLVTADYIDLAQIARVSLFRSSTGHDYWDDVEHCRSMKHYFAPRMPDTGTTIAIRAPLDAEVARIHPEWAGVQLHLRSRSHPAFTVILFHVTLSITLAVGDRVDAGQTLGSHVGPQTASDVAVAVDSPTGRRLISYFQIMGESVWAAYVQRGVATRRELIITREARDADPLQCDGQGFLTTGTLPQWRDLP